MYEELKTALLGARTIPMAEYEWATRPKGDYGVFRIDFEVGDDNGDDLHQDRGWQGSADLYTHGAKADVYTEIETILDTYAEGCWYVNSIQVESETRLLHREYVFELEAY